MKRRFVRICPKCRSTNVVSNMSATSIGIGTFQNEYRCNDCGFTGMFFPEVAQGK